MKIKDVTIKEAAPGKVPPQPTLNGKPSTGPKGQAWLQKYGATHNPDGTPKVNAMAGADAGNQTSSGYTAQDQAQQTPQAAASTSADIAAAGAAFQSQQPAPAAPVADPKPAVDPSVAAGQNLGAMAAKEKDSKSAADFQKLAGISPTTSAQPAAPAAPVVPVGLASATTPQAGGSAPSGPTATADPEGTGSGQAAQPAAQVNPDTGLSTAPKPVTSGSGQPVKTGTGGTVTSRSQDELAWASKQPMGGTGQQYPGPGNWDPKTGRTVKKEQASTESTEMQLIRKLAGLR